MTEQRVNDLLDAFADRVIKKRIVTIPLKDGTVFKGRIMEAKLCSGGKDGIIYLKGDITFGEISEPLSKEIHLSDISDNYSPD